MGHHQNHDGLKHARAVFLDRDGVLNASVVREGRPYPPDSLADVRILPGVKETLQAFHNAGFKNIVVTNQPDVATGKQRREVVEAIHGFMLKELNIDDIRTCYCVEGDDCDCYKPKPKMLIDAARQWHIDLTQSFMVGDRWRDIGAGKAAGCKTFFIDYDYGERRPDNPDYIVKDLAEAGRIILSGRV